MEHTATFNKEKSNVISILNWKLSKEEQRDVDNYKRYLYSLRMDGLMSEIDAFMNDISSISIHGVHIGRGKLILEEISQRISKSSPQMGKAVFDVQKNLSMKILG